MLAVGAGFVPIRRGPLIERKPSLSVVVETEALSYLSLRLVMAKSVRRW